MKKFIKKIFYFLFILGGINFLLYYSGQELYYRKYNNPSLEFNSYLLSDSHGGRLYNYTEKYGVYNFSDGSDSYLDMYRKTIYLIMHAKVDTIFITVGDHTLSPYREKNNNSDRSIKYCTISDFDNIYSFLREAILPYYFPLFQPKVGSITKLHLESKLKSIFSTEKPSSKIKFIPWKLKEYEDRRRSSIKRVKLQFEYENSSSSLSLYLKKIISISKANNIELIGIKYPLAKEYIEVLNNKSFDAEKYFKENGLKIYDFTDIYIYKREYFENQDHLNKLGGKVFVDDLFNKIRV